MARKTRRWTRQASGAATKAGTNTRSAKRGRTLSSGWARDTVARVIGDRLWASSTLLARNKLERRGSRECRRLRQTTRDEWALASALGLCVLDSLLRVAEHLAPDALLATVVLVPRFVLEHGRGRVRVDADIHDGALDAVIATLLLGEQPRRVDVVGVQVAQCRNPQLDELSVRIVIFALL